MAPLTTAIKRDMNRQKNIISAVEDNLLNKTPNYDSLQMDRGDMEKLLDEICDKVARLTVIQQDTQLQNDVEVIIETAYNILRNVNLCLRSNQNPKLAVTLLNDNLLPTNTESNSRTLTTSLTSHTQAQASISTSMAVAPSHTSNPQNLQPMGVPTVSPPTPIHFTMAITSQQYNPVSSLPMVGSVYLPTSQPATPPTSIILQSPSSVTSTTTSPDILYPAYSLSTILTSELNTFVQTGSPLIQSWYYNTAQAPAPAHVIVFAQPVRPAQPHILQQPYPSTPRIYNNANINLKKTPLLTFSGHRSGWPGFKAVWKQLAELYTPTKLL